MTEQRKPVPPPTVENIPAELLNLTQWVVWRYEWRKDKWTKVPFTPHTTHKARSNAASTWRSFRAAYSCYQDRPDYFDGIGFMFSKDDPYVGGDIDHCIDDGLISADALAILPPTYAEISPSGCGIKFIARASGDYGRKTARGELYSARRFFTMTGNVLAGHTEIVECRVAVDTFEQSLGATAKTVRDGSGGQGSRAERVKQIPDEEWEAGRALLRDGINRLLARLRASAISKKTKKYDTQLGLLLREEYRAFHDRWPNAGIVRADGSIDESQVRAMFANSIRFRRFTFPEYAALMSHFFAEQCLAKWGTKQAWREELASLWLRSRTPRADDPAAELPIAEPAPRGRAGSRSDLLERAYQVLLTFKAGAEALFTLADLADALGVHYTTASRIVSDLAESGRITYRRAGQYGGLVASFPDLIYSENTTGDIPQQETTNGHYPDRAISATNGIDQVSGLIYSENDKDDLLAPEADKTVTCENTISAEDATLYIYKEITTIPCVSSPVSIKSEKRIRDRVSLADAVAEAFDELPRDRAVEGGELKRWPVTDERVREYIDERWPGQWRYDAICYWIQRIRKRRRGQPFDELRKLRREDLDRKATTARKRIEAAERKAKTADIPELREWYAKRASQLGGQLAMLAWEMGQRDTADAARIETEGYTQGEQQEMLDLVERSRDDTAGMIARLKARKHGD